MGECKRISVSLFLSSPLHRKAWEILNTVPAGQRTEAICLALCQKEDRAAFIRELREMIHEELKDRTVTIREDTAPKAVDVDESVLGFLRSL